MAKGIGILGSTGSIGCQTLEVCKGFPDAFRVIGISAQENVELLEKQARMFKPKIVVIGNKKKGPYLKGRLNDLPITVYEGNEALEAIVTNEEIDTVVTAVSGSIGLVPTLQAIKAGKNIALANKETLVSAGELVMEAARQYGCQLIPVDSEHSALFQCLAGNKIDQVRRMILTASGGPFRGMNAEEMNDITPAQALKHPNWSMGAKISIDSATLMNKGLEVIEAKHLFGVNYDLIDVIIHPQSIIHSMVQYIDGSILAQMGAPDMRIPIQYALTWPERWKGLPNTSIELMEFGNLTFETPDYQAFPALNLAYEAGRLGGTMPAVLNAANEEAVHAFLKGKVSFRGITEIVERVMEQHELIRNPNLEVVLNSDEKARVQAWQLIEQLN